MVSSAPKLRVRPSVAWLKPRLERIRHRALGNDGHLARPSVFRLPKRISERAPRYVEQQNRSRHTRQLRSLRDANYRGSWRGAHAHRQADRLYVGRQRFSDRRARGRDSHRGPVPNHNAVAFDLAVSTYGLGRVIARPFRFGQPGTFKRTANRKDFAMPPTSETMLDRLRAAHMPTIAIGKIEDLFARQGITRALHTGSDEEGMDAITSEMASTARGLDLREPCRLRHDLRAPQRCFGLRLESGAVRRQS